MRPTFTTLHVKTENSCEFVDLLYIFVYILDEIKLSFTEFSFTEPLRWHMAHTKPQQLPQDRFRAGFV